MKKYTIFTAVAAMLFATPVLAGDYFVNGAVGTHTAGRGEALFNLGVGKEVHDNLRVELQYSRDDQFQKNNGFAHVIPQYRIPTTAFTPYLLAGVGTDLEKLDARPLYALGGGMRIDLNKSWEVDFRYRQVESVQKVDERKQVSVGLGYRF